MLKNLIVEPYDPLAITRQGLVMTPQLRLNMSYVFNGACLAGITTAAFALSFYWFFTIIGLVIFSGLFCEQIFLRKRVETAGDPRAGAWHDSWCSKDTADSNIAYNQQLLDYIDHLRTGGLTVPSIEDELRQWITLEESHKRRRIEESRRLVNESLSRKEQLEEYERMI